MAWATHSLLKMEATQQGMAAEAAVQERVRLALWRMESISAALVVAESARPPEQYHAATTEAPLISPASRIRLHFELDAAGLVRSPQAGEGPERQGIPDEASARLAELRARLADKAGVAQIAGIRARRDAGGIKTNADFVRLANVDAEGDAASWEEEASVSKTDDAPPGQKVNSQTEADMRLRAVGEFAKSTSQSRQQSLPPINPKRSSPKPANEVALNAAPAPRAKARPTGKDASSIGQAVGSRLAEELMRDDNQVGAATGSVMPAAEAKDEKAGTPSGTVSDFRALWLDDALLLTRRVNTTPQSVVQGAWVDWPQVRTELLGAIRDLFPNARLDAAMPMAGGGTDLLASLPIRLVPGALDLAATSFWSPLKLSLATAWGCILLASLAVGLVLRGMMQLSERRASFVSAVTHELRTPLATFKLYSEMLADGLVKDPVKRQGYLETLTTEADRLSHLVENVLSYSKLEQGAGSDGRRHVAVAELQRRVEPRLHQRVATAGASFMIEVEEAAQELEVWTDTSAVEQILFNLVDNACKYGGHAGTAAQIELRLYRDRYRLVMAVRDHGPGIGKGEAGKLFRPFHKSAREAAHSAPGVGLGLALCRRLAGELGATLEVDTARAEGACFLLSLPLSVASR